ncbi:NACHT domain-containing protein [Umezawaea sp.]|uniref:NACHT domain-containing protein n=1 Tax=Umezawaea sp. TaxID=1955258 RepID=UPI002ED137F8
MAAGADLTTLPLSYGAVALLLVAALIWAAKQYLGEFFKKSGASAFDRSRRPLSRGAKFRRRLVRRYADAVEQDFTRHPVGFVADQVIDINETYVPLQYELDGERRDVYDNIRENPCTVVIGPAGAGKSLLLKSSMLTWAKRVRGGRSERVPVLIELHRCNGTSDSLVDLIVAELARARVDRSRGGGRIRELVQQALDDGALSLLFDGLDEVGRADQERVFAALRDFAREYGDCQFVVTCRDVVYQGQPLGPRFSHVVRVAEFDDAGVIRFLGSWRGLGDATARAEIFGSLRKNPALMRLARSPLLLTMIAYLHTEVFTKTGRRLPTSRPAFYQEAITHLLGRDADLGRARSLTVYEVGEKLAVLQKVALTSMESTGTSVDRLTISRMTLETTTKALLPDLNLDDSHIKPLLDEIVDRSQLLVAVDKRKAHYVFRHLTLQEYLAATELADSPDSLLERYLADPLAWRETVKLWCGASNRDSTKVIAEIFGSPEAHHKILALECLSEAKRVDGDFATAIVNHFLRQLGVVCRGSGPRGRRRRVGFGRRRQQTARTGGAPAAREPRAVRRPGQGRRHAGAVGVREAGGGARPRPAGRRGCRRPGGTARDG